MPSPLLDKHVPHFDERSNYAFIVLGLVSMARRIEHWSSHAERRPSIRLAADRDADGFLHFSLGIVSLSQRFLSAAILARNPPRDDAPHAHAEKKPSLRNLAL